MSRSLRARDRSKARPPPLDTKEPEYGTPDLDHWLSRPRRLGADPHIAGPRTRRPHRTEWLAPIARDIKVSFDGATAPTFERLRRGASFERVCANVRGLVDRLRRVRVRRPIVALQMTLMRDNVDELPALIHRARELGADRVKAYHLFSFRPDLDEQSLMGHLDHYEREVLPTSLALGEALGVDIQLAEPSGGDPGALRPRVCHRTIRSDLWFPACDTCDDGYRWVLLAERGLRQ